MRLLIALAVWIGAVAGAVEVSALVAGSIHTPSAQAAASGSGGGSSGGGSSTGGGGSTGGGSSSPAPVDPSTVKPTDPQSMFDAANLARALAAVSAHLGAGARVDTLALYPGYLALTTVKGGSEVNVYIPAGGDYTATSGGSPGGSRLLSLEQVKADAPATLASRIATAGHVPESQLNYMVAQADPSSGHLRWLIYPRQGNRVEYFEAAGAGAPLFEYRTDSSTGLQRVRG